jgi:hypothetical protein
MYKLVVLQPEISKLQCDLATLCGEAESRDLGDSATCEGARESAHIYGNKRAKTKARASV